MRKTFSSHFELKIVLQFCENFFLVDKIVFCKILGNKTFLFTYFIHIFFVQQNIVLNFCNKIFLSPNSKRKYSSHFAKENFLHIFEKNIFFIFFNRIFFSQISNIFLFWWKNSMWKKNSFAEIFGEQNILLQFGEQNKMLTCAVRGGPQNQVMNKKTSEA